MNYEEEGIDPINGFDEPSADILGNPLEGDIDLEDVLGEEDDLTENDYQGIDL